MSRFHLIYIPQYTPLVFWWMCLQYAWNQIFWQDITSVLMWGTTKIQFWWRWCFDDMDFRNSLFADCICISTTITWCPYYFLTCFITNKLHIGIIDIFRIIHYFLTCFHQSSSYVIQFFLITICLYEIINLKIRFPGS